MNRNYEVTTSAPAVVKLLGEHAVVYGRFCVAAAIEKYATVRIGHQNGNNVELNFVNIPGSEAKQVVTLDKITSIYEQFASRDGISDFLMKQKGENRLLLPCAIILGEFKEEFNVDLKNTKITFSSDIPMQYGLASSAALSTALTIALSKLTKIKIPNEKLIDIARNGERVIHENENSGRIDVNTSFYGNIVGFDVKSGADPIKLDYELPILLIDTGPKKKTSEMVANVAELYGTKKDETERTLDAIDECSVKGLTALKRGDLVELGQLMFKDQELLKSLQVSSDGIDMAVSISKANGAYGAKLSGGGGGGIVLAIAQDKDRLTSAILNAGFKVSETRISRKGAIDYV